MYGNNSELEERNRMMSIISCVVPFSACFSGRRQCVRSEHGRTCTRLHDFTSKKMVLFLLTVVGVSDPTQKCSVSYMKTSPEKLLFMEQRDYGPSLYSVSPVPIQMLTNTVQVSSDKFQPLLLLCDGVMYSLHTNKELQKN
jgi:hypothetical protein